MNIQILRVNAKHKQQKNSENFSKNTTITYEKNSKKKYIKILKLPGEKEEKQLCKFAWNFRENGNKKKKCRIAALYIYIHTHTHKQTHTARNRKTQ